MTTLLLVFLLELIFKYILNWWVGIYLYYCTQIQIISQCDIMLNMRKYMNMKWKRMYTQDPQEVMPNCAWVQIFAFKLPCLYHKRIFARGGAWGLCIHLVYLYKYIKRRIPYIRTPLFSSRLVGREKDLRYIILQSYVIEKWVKIYQLVIVYPFF